MKIFHIARRVIASGYVMPVLARIYAIFIFSSCFPAGKIPSCNYRTMCYNISVKGEHPLLKRMEETEMTEKEKITMFLTVKGTVFPD